MPSHSLIHDVERAARIGGDIAYSHFGRGIPVQIKSDGSEVTRADREAEIAVRSWIEDRFPADKVVGEEFGETGPDGPRRWLIDPIDGTRSFVRGVPLWGSLVAVEENGTLVAGAIYCPATGDMVVARTGEGCWHNGNRTYVSVTDSVANATVLATDDRFRRDPSRVAKWMELSRRAAISRSWGDCYGYVLVATGRAELMVDDRMSPWDIAALIPIIEEAGGVITDWQGRRGIGADAIASNAALAAEFRALLGVPDHQDLSA